MRLICIAIINNRGLRHGLIQDHRRDIHDRLRIFTADCCYCSYQELMVVIVIIQIGIGALVGRDWHDIHV